MDAEMRTPVKMKGRALGSATLVMIAARPRPKERAVSTYIGSSSSSA